MQDAHTLLAAGTVLHEHYSIESLLGRGNFGNLYFVRDQRDKQKLFALAEVINPIEGDTYRFTLDYISLAPLDRGVLPRVQYAFNDDTSGRAYLLMRFIEEPNLEMLRLQQAEAHFPPDQVIAMINPVIQALACLHGRRPPVLHRNINPSTIIISQAADKPVLVMLNIFKEHDSNVIPQYYLTPGYGATEQYSEKCSPASDIYGLGATCYTLLTGSIPPDALSRSTRLRNGEVDPLKRVLELIPALPTSIAEAIQRAMSIDADERFSSVEEFREALGSQVTQFSARQLLSTPLPVPLPEQPASTRKQELDDVLEPSPADEQPVHAPVPVHARAFRTQPRHPWKLAGVFMLLVLLVGLGAEAGFWAYTRSLSAARSPLSTPSVTMSSPITATAFIPSRYPLLAGTYSGTMYDVSNNVSATMSLTTIRQNQAAISGYLVVGPGIQGSGHFSGTIDVNKRFQFSVVDVSGKARLSLEGVIQSASSLSGEYYSCDSVGLSQNSALSSKQCNHSTTNYGIWNAVLT